VPSIARVVALLLVAVLIGITPAAYAEPVDPLWLAGYWDDDDFDNVVIFITGTCAIFVPASVQVGPVSTPVAHVEAKDSHAPPPPLRTAACPRAPPIASTSRN